MGKVIKLYSDGDLRVSFDGQTWTLNPLCVQPVSVKNNEVRPNAEGLENGSMYFNLQFMMFFVVSL